jgi:hypothetical protein
MPWRDGDSVPRRASPTAWALGAVAAAVLAANVPYLLGIVQANPLVLDSGLATASHGILAGLPTLDSNAGQVSQALGHLAAQDLLHLHLPWWNPYEGTGAPLAGEMQSAAFFPPTLLTALSNGQLYEHIFLELVAGFSTFALLRRLELHRAAATAGAIAFALNGTYAWLGNAVVNPVAFLPLLLLGIEIAYSAAIEGRAGGWWLIAVAGMLSVYAGFPEVTYLNTIFAVLWSVWRAVALRGAALRGFAGKALCGALAGTLLSAPIVIAFVDYLGHAYLWQHGAGILDSVHLTRYSLAQLLLPYVYGAPDGPQIGSLSLFVWAFAGGYISALLGFLAVAGIVLPHPRRGLALFLLAWTVLALSAIYATPPLLWHVLVAVPGMSHVEVARYAFSSLELAVIVAAALGLDAILRAPRASGRLLTGAAIAVIVIVLALHDAAPIEVRGYFPVSVAWALATVVALVAIAHFCRGPRRPVLLACLVAADAVGLFVIAELAAPRSARVDLAPVAYLRAHLGESRFFTLGPLTPNYGTYFGVPSLNAMDVPVPSRFADYVRRLDPGADPTGFTGAPNPLRPRGLPSAQEEMLLHLDAYRAAGVGYLVASEGAVPGPPSAFVRVFTSPHAWVFRVLGAQPYFTASRGCAVTSSSREAVTVRCPTAATLVRRETFLPGWHAAVDGHPAAVRPVDGLFQAVRLPPGTHEVRFAFAPPNEVWGLIALLAGAAWLVVPARSVRGRRERA